MCALVGGRGGKTTGARARLLRKAMLIPQARLLFIATTRPHAEDLMWGPLKELNERLKLGAIFHESKLVMTLPQTDAQIKVVGAADRAAIETLRGIPRHEVIIDEAASIKPKLLDNLIDEVLGPRLGDYNGVLVLIGTPSSTFRGKFWEVTRSGSERSRPYSERDHPDYEGWRSWSFHNWAVKDGAEWAYPSGRPRIPEMANAWANALEKKEDEGWEDDNPVWRREYLGKWAADDTANVFNYLPFDEDEDGNAVPFNQWDPPRDPKTGLAVLPEGHEWLFSYGMDLGASDPFALEVFAFSFTTRTLYHVAEFARPKQSVRSIAAILLGTDPETNDVLKPKDKKGLMGATGWPTGLVADIDGLGGMILRDFLEVYSIPIEPAKKRDKFDAIELFNGDLQDGRIKILKGSVLEEQLQDLQWDIDEYGKLRENKGQRNDCTDAAIYARREAMHLIDQERQPVGPARGTTEHWLKEQERRAGFDEDLDGEFADYQGDDGFDHLFG